MSTPDVSLASLIKHNQQRFEHQFSQTLLALPELPATLKQAMHYSAMNGGKRLRPFLCYCVGEMLGANAADLNTVACAIEAVHCYSLIHDDLPAMDDDDLRRGKPTCHIQFDEATAILAGDALQTLAFELLAEHAFSVDAKQQLKLIAILAKASGYLGMCGGQAMDIAATNKPINALELEQVHRRKTGALIEAAVLLGAYCAPNLDKHLVAQLSEYAQCIGLAFQVQDDILDVIGDTALLGKTQGADAELGKSTYPALMGLPQATAFAQQLVQQALQSLQQIPYNTEPLAQFANFIITREY